MPHTGLTKQNGKEYKPMALPLVAAAAGVVARFIAKRGLAAAAKKFTKKAVDEGKKHAADVLKKDGGKTAEKAANIKKMKPVQSANANSRATLRKGIAVGGTGVGAASLVKISELKVDLKKAKTAEQRAKLQTRIEKEVAKVKAAEQSAKDKGNTKSRTENTNTRRGNNEKVPQGTRVPTSKPGVKKSLRPKLRPFKDGGMPMVMKDGKKVPAYAADGIGKMNKGGMAMKKPTKKMMAGGMAKKKPAAKKMMAGGMAKKKMMGGGMAKTGYMYGGMAKKTKAKK